MAAPAFAAYTVTVDNSLTLTTPTGAASGDLLIAVFESDGNSDWSAGSNGFIAGGRLYSTIDCTIEWFYLPLNSAPAASYTWTRTGTGACRGWMIRVTGAASSGPIDVSGFQEDSVSNTTHDLPTLTTTVADTLLLAFSLVSSGAAYTSGEFTPPSGYTEISETGTAWCHVSAAWKTQATAGSTGSASFTGISAPSLQLLLAIKPAGGTTYTQSFSSSLGLTSATNRQDQTRKAVSLTLASSLVRAPSRILGMPLSLVSALVRNTARGLATSLPYSSAYSASRTAIQGLSTALSLMASLTRATARIFTGALPLASASTRSTIRTLAVELPLAATFAAVQTYLRALSALLPLSASVSRMAQRSLLSPLSLASSLTRGVQRGLGAPLALASAFGVIKAYTRSLAVGLDLNTALIRFTRRGFAMPLALASSLSRSLRRGLAALLGLATAFFRQLSGMTSQSPVIIDRIDFDLVHIDVVAHITTSDRIGLQVRTDAINL